MLEIWVVLGSVIIILLCFAALVGWRASPLFVGAEEGQPWLQGVKHTLRLFSRQNQPAPKAPPVSKSTRAIIAPEAAVVAQDKGVAAGQIAVGRDVQGDVIMVADPEALWHIMTNNAPSPDLREATQRYLEHVIDRYRYLDFRGMGISDRIPLRLSLVDMYVPLKARLELPEGDTWARDLSLAGYTVGLEEADVMGPRLSAPQSIPELINGYSGLIILGDPGAGKTTILKYIALRLAAGEGEALGLANKIPILIPLSAYANVLAEKDVPLDRFVVSYYRDRGINLPLESMLAEVLERGGGLLLLDGLDEVNDLLQRKIVVERVVDFFSFHRRRGNKFILTSRIVGYREVRVTAEELVECTLVDFEADDIVEFIDRWTIALERAARGGSNFALEAAYQERTGLLNAIIYNPGVRSLAANPLLLTVLALMKRQGITLPERRVELYHKYLETLLKTWNIARGLGRPVTRQLDMVETLRILAPLALWMHQTNPGIGLFNRQAIHQKLSQIYRQRGLAKPHQAAERLLVDMREYSGLLVERGAREYGFIHLTFQEYLAAIAIAQQSQRDFSKVAQMLSAHVGDDNWYEVTLLTIGYIGIIQQLDEIAGRIVRQLIKDSPGEPGEVIVLMGEAVLDAWPGGVDPQTQRMVRQVLAKTMVADQAVRPDLRSAAADTLANFNNKMSDSVSPVFEMEFSLIPAGPFWMGSLDDDIFSDDDESPLHQVDLDYNYWLSQFPVTVAQFEQFVIGGGYKEAKYWQQAQANGFWHNGELKTRAWSPDEEGAGEVYNLSKGPKDFGRPFNLPNHPVVGISWYEALAFCYWLSDLLKKEGYLPENWQVALPTEQEWEKGARGGLQIPENPLVAVLKDIDLPKTAHLKLNHQTQRRYPYGNEIDLNRTNCDQTGLRSTSAVGCFPNGASPYGCQDMSGNVWEWCSTVWEDNYYAYQNDNTLAIHSPRVLRGGAYVNSEDFVRCASRVYGEPDYGGRQEGFRVVLRAV